MESITHIEITSYTIRALIEQLEDIETRYPTATIDARVINED